MCPSLSVSESDKNQWRGSADLTVIHLALFYASFFVVLVDFSGFFRWSAAFVLALEYVSLLLTFVIFQHLLLYCVCCLSVSIEDAFHHHSIFYFSIQ